MNKAITIWDIVHYIGILILFIALTIGLLYMTKGSLAMSLGIAVLLSAVFFGIVVWLKSLKQATEYQDKKKLTEIAVLIGGYGIAFLVTFPIVLHFMNVNIGAKNDIKNALTNESENISQMVAAYEQHVEAIGDDFDTETKVALKQGRKQKQEYIQKYGLDDIKSSTVDVFVANMKSKLITELDNVRTVYDDYALSLEAAAESFNPLAVPGLYYDMDVTSNQLKDDLIDISKSNKRGSESPFSFESEKRTLGDISDVRSLFPLTNWLYTLLGLLLLHFMLLSPYIFGDRAANTLVDSQGGRETGFRM